MKNNFKRLLSLFILILSLMVMLAPLSMPVNADEDRIITLVHTNDMHGRLNQIAEGYTWLSRLDSYVKTNDVDFVFDAGDAIQGLPISNLNQGQKMLEAMNEIGYDVMTIGNHEFDFGLDRLVTLRDSGLVPMVSNNVIKDGASVFERTKTLTKDGITVGVVGITTPETSTKTHPNNITGVSFNEPIVEVQKDVQTLKDAGVNLIVVLAHLGVDLETPEHWRGNTLAQTLSETDVGIPILVIDGHSHTTFENGVRYGENVLYVQTGALLSSFGVVDINLDDFSKSTAKLVKPASVVVPDGQPAALTAEIEAKASFDAIGNEEVFDGLEFILSSNQEIVRRREAALGNLITDAMMSYGQGFSEVPDLAVINGGGIRADLTPSTITVGDIIAVLPFGNVYSSIKVTGQQIVDMFEYSYRTEVGETEEGIRALEKSGGFLHVSGAKIVYNASKPVGSRIETIWIERGADLELLDLEATYTLATNDFLAVGGDGFTMLGGPRIEGEGLDEVFRSFLASNGATLDWSLYEVQAPRTRTFLIEVRAETMTSLQEVLAQAIALIDDSDDYPVNLINELQALVNNAQTYLEKPEDYTQALHESHIDALYKGIFKITGKKITLVHTNDMHGRLNQIAEGYTWLSRLDSYVKTNDVDFVFDAGDAIQGLPISNLNYGHKMLAAMNEIGYDAMTIGNHEFDFGLDQLETLRDLGLVPMVSNNVIKDGVSVFERTKILTKDGITVGVVGVTTPETSTKTHPNNITGVSFNEPIVEVQKDVQDLKNAGVDLIVVLAHLGVDLETPVNWRGNTLAQTLSETDVGVPMLVIDGHSHTAFENGVRYGENVLYVQTGALLSSFGVVDINLDDFSKSTAKLIKPASVVVADGQPEALTAEVEAKASFDAIGNEEVYDGLEYILSSNQEIVRRREAALGNLITDAMMSYGQGFSQVPDLAVINGGGIRADLTPSTITVGDIISVLPFGNMYSSIRVTGQQIVDMFEHSYRTEVGETEEGIRALEKSGGFLHVSGAKIVYNAAKPVGSRIEAIWIERGSDLELLDLEATYTLATNDFLAVGGDGFTMLGGPRIEGEGLDEVFRSFLASNGATLDWSLYEVQAPRTRTFLIEIPAETMTSLQTVLAQAIALIDDSDEYPIDEINKLQAVINIVNSYLEKPVDYSLALHQAHIQALSAAIGVFEESRIEEKPKVSEKPKEELPDTGMTVWFNPAAAFIVLGAATIAYTKRKED